MPTESENTKQKWTKQATGRVLAALNRADEIGGEVRDYIQDKLTVDPRYIKARKTVAKWLGREYVSREEAASQAAAAEATVYQRRLATAEDAEITAKLESDGAEIVRLTAAERAAFVTALTPVLERHRKDFDPEIFAALEKG